MCFTCKSLLDNENPANQLEFLKLSSLSFEKISNYADDVSVNVNEADLSDVLHHDDEDMYIKTEAIDIDDEPLVKSEMVETVLTEDVNVKLEGFINHAGC